MSASRSQILQTAEQFVNNDRNSQYDEPERNFERIAARWNLSLENAFQRGFVQPHEVAILLMDVKMARLTASPESAEHWIDIAGYAACGGEIATHVEHLDGGNFDAKTLPARRIDVADTTWEEGK